MSLFTLYCDDSGTHAASNIAVAGALIASVEQWHSFAKAWNEVNKREHFGVFHMADFENRQAQFAEKEWEDEEKRLRTIRALLQVIQQHAKFAIGAAVIKTAYDDLIHGDLRAHLGENHYTFAVRLVISCVGAWRKRIAMNEPIKYVLDRLPRGQRRIADMNAAFELAASGGDLALLHYGICSPGNSNGWALESKASVIQLQAADVWAYESYRWARDTFFASEELKAPMRENYKGLRLGIQNMVRYHNHQSLKEFLEKACH